MRNSIILYTTSACHLCEQAEHVLERLQASGEVRLTVQKVDIADDEALLAAYGSRIPVLARQDGAELDWPFGEVELLRWVARSSGRRVL
jgi:hypothetical protein